MEERTRKSVYRTAIRLFLLLAFLALIRRNLTWEVQLLAITGSFVLAGLRSGTHHPKAAPGDLAPVVPLVLVGIATVGAWVWLWWLKQEWVSLVAAALIGGLVLYDLWRRPRARGL
jgi:hypothetical protein